MKTAAHPSPHEPEWAAAIQKEVSPMNHVTASLVTDEAPATLIHDDGLVAIRFISGNAFTVILPQTMTPDQKAAWCIGFAKELTDLAADIQSETATVAP